ncbi:MAG: glycoside hydrolase family 5 protein [Vampirovibrionales bacterium]|nr:glycoside hydrolase family 5 protein [Vampirovibrionales bacterium]
MTKRPHFSKPVITGLLALSLVPAIGAYCQSGYCQSKVTINQPAATKSVAMKATGQKNGQPSKAEKLRDRNFANLKKGIGMYGWMNGYKVNSLEERRNFYTNEELRNLKEIGFTHIRLPITPYILVGNWESRQINPQGIELLDQAIQRILDHKLAVVVEMAPDEPSPLAKNLATSDQAVENFAWLWDLLSKRYAKLDTERVFFEVLNEPHFDAYLKPEQAKSRWDYVVGKIVPVIRKNAPDNTIIVTGYDWSYASSMKKVKLLDDQNIVYTFHYYDPMVFTHQGTSWIQVPDVGKLKNMPYPPTAENCAAFKQGMVTKTPDFVDRYCESFKPDAITKQMDSIGDWAQKNNLKVYMGEFGVHKNPSLPQARAAYIEDVRQAAEKNGIAWSMWDYKQGFDIMKPHSATEYDPMVLNALGLKPPKEVSIK